MRPGSNVSHAPWRATNSNSHLQKCQDNGRSLTLREMWSCGKPEQPPSWSCVTRRPEILTVFPFHSLSPHLPKYPLERPRAQIMRSCTRYAGLLERNSQTPLLTKAPQQASSVRLSCVFGTAQSLRGQSVKSKEHSRNSNSVQRCLAVRHCRQGQSSEVRPIYVAGSKSNSGTRICHSAPRLRPGKSPGHSGDKGE